VQLSAAPVRAKLWLAVEKIAGIMLWIQSNGQIQPEQTLDSMSQDTRPECHSDAARPLLHLSESGFGSTTI